MHRSLYICMYFCCFSDKRTGHSVKWWAPFFIIFNREEIKRNSQRFSQRDQKLFKNLFQAELNQVTPLDCSPYLIWFDLVVHCSIITLFYGRGQGRGHHASWTKAVSQICWNHHWTRLYDIMDTTVVILRISPLLQFSRCGRYVVDISPGGYVVPLCFLCKNMNQHSIFIANKICCVISYWHVIVIFIMCNTSVRESMIIPHWNSVGHLLIEVFFPFMW